MGKSEPARIGFTVRRDPTLPDHIVIDTLDGDGRTTSFLLTSDQVARLRDDLAYLVPRG